MKIGLTIIAGLAVIMGIYWISASQTPIVEENKINVSLFLYNPKLDQGPGGVECSSKGLVAISRAISETSTPLKDSIGLLLKGELSQAEKNSGLTTEFPLEGLSLVTASIQNGIANLTFSDPQNKTSGGSCRVSILRAQIEATAKQFPAVTSVRILPEELFQP